MVTKGQKRKDHSVSAIFLIFSIFNNRNQMSLFSCKAYVKLITMTTTATIIEGGKVVKAA